MPRNFSDSSNSDSYSMSDTDSGIETMTIEQLKAAIRNEENMQGLPSTEFDSEDAIQMTGSLDQRNDLPDLNNNNNASSHYQADLEEQDSENSDSDGDEDMDDFAQYLETEMEMISSVGQLNALPNSIADKGIRNLHQCLKDCHDQLEADSEHPTLRYSFLRNGQQEQNFTCSKFKNEGPAQIHITTYQTLDRQKETFPYTKYKDVICDEGHQVLSNNRDAIIGKFIEQGAHLLNLTATPIYTMRKVESNLRSTYALSGYAEPDPLFPNSKALPLPPITPVSTVEAIKAGRLSSMQTGIVHLPLSQKTETANNNNNNKNVIDQPILNNSWVHIYARHFLGQQGLVFCAGTEHADHMAEAFNRQKALYSDPLVIAAKERYAKNYLPYHDKKHNEYRKELRKIYNKKNYEDLRKRLDETYSDFKRPFKEISQEIVNKNFRIAAATHSKIKNSKEIIKDYKRGRYLVLTGAGQFIEGFDHQGARVALNAANTESRTVAKQRGGRVGRDPNEVGYVLDAYYGEENSKNAIFYTNILNGQTFCGNSPEKQSQIPVTNTSVKLEGEYINTQVQWELSKELTIVLNKKKSYSTARPARPTQPSNIEISFVQKISEVQSALAQFPKLLEHFTDMLALKDLTIKTTTSSQKRKRDAITPSKTQRTTTATTQTHVAGNNALTRATQEKIEALNNEIRGIKSRTNNLLEQLQEPEEQEIDSAPSTKKIN